MCVSLRVYVCKYFICIFLTGVIVSYKKPEEYNSPHTASPKTSYFYVIGVDLYLKRIECQDYNYNNLMTWIVEVTGKHFKYLITF